MELVKPRTLSGFMELLPPEERAMQRFMQTLRQSYELYGFTPLDTPVIESSEVLLAKGGGETEKQIYRFSKGDADLSLRFDLTVPLAKYVALHAGELQFPFRRYQIGKVYRGERAQRGRFREFYQADIDIIGDGKPDIINEAEIPSVIYRTFTALGLERFRIRINNRKLLGGFFEILDISEPAAVMRIIDKLEKVGAEKLRAMLIDDAGLSDSACGEILAFLEASATTEGAAAAIEKYCGRSELFDTGADELMTVARYMGDFGVPPEAFAIDFTIARGLDYYTGTVYETVMTDHPEIGSICSGGRYDDLAGYYTSRKLPGVGISIGLTRLFYILGEQNMLDERAYGAPADLLVLPMTEDVSAAARLATSLRDAGIRVQVYCEKKKFGAKISYADKLGIPFVAFLGEDELASNRVTVKELATGEQSSFAPEELAAWLAGRIAERQNVRLIREGQ